MIEEMVAATGADEVEVFISGPANFRYRVYPEYKANRLDAKRPKWENQVKEYLIIHWNAVISKGCEADDLLGMRCTELGKDSCIATTDKDLDMIPGWHYNFVKKELYYIEPEKAIYNFYYQCLVGDVADGVKGVPGIGPVKAGRILANCESEREMFEAVREAYGVDEAFEMNAKVLWIWRKPNDVWEWPKNVEKLS